MNHDYAYAYTYAYAYAYAFVGVCGSGWEDRNLVGQSVLVSRT
jgi:hypothetical protein